MLPRRRLRARKSASLEWPALRPAALMFADSSVPPLAVRWSSNQPAALLVAELASAVSPAASSASRMDWSRSPVHCTRPIRSVGRSVRPRLFFGCPRQARRLVVRVEHHEQHTASDGGEPKPDSGELLGIARDAHGLSVEDAQL